MKGLCVFVLGAIATLTLAASAAAHNGSIEITCQGVTFTYTNFPSNSTNESDEVITVNGATVHDDTFTFTGPGQHTVPLNINGNATVTASFHFTSSDGAQGRGSGEKALSCGGTTGTTTTTEGPTTTTEGPTTTTEGPTTTTEGPTTTTEGPTSGTTGGTTGGGGGGGAGGAGGGETGELPFTGLPIWVPLLAAAALLASGLMLIRRRKGEPS